MLCSTCNNQTCLKTKKPCQDVENELRKDGIWSRNWIRPQMSSCRRDDRLGRSREIGTNNLDNLATGRAFRIKYGKKSHKNAKIDHEG